MKFFLNNLRNILKINNIKKYKIFLFFEISQEKGLKQLFKLAEFRFQPHQFFKYHSSIGFGRVTGCLE